MARSGFKESTKKRPGDTFGLCCRDGSRCWIGWRADRAATFKYTGFMNNQPPLAVDPDEIVESSASSDPDEAVSVYTVLREMGDMYRENPVKAVRGQGFIKLLHTYIGSQLEVHLTDFAKARGISVVPEATLLGSTKPKDVDISVIDPHNGPLVIVGVRSQMSSVGKNALNYYEGIVGECISLQQRFPMASHAYIYLHPLNSIKEGRENEAIKHRRYARMYAAVTGREGLHYYNQRGLFDHFAYMVVDFDQSPPQVRDDIVQEAVPELDMMINTLVARIIDTFKKRMILWDIFD
jgi:hypothetical protein